MVMMTAGTPTRFASPTRCVYCREGITLDLDVMEDEGIEVWDDEFGCDACDHDGDSERAHRPVITDAEAAEIASMWHSVMTWNDPGVVMYSVTSTAKVHSEDHRRKLVAYIDACMTAAVDADASGQPDDHGVIFSTNVADLEALRAWAIAFVIPAGKATP